MLRTDNNRQSHTTRLAPDETQRRSTLVLKVLPIFLIPFAASLLPLLLMQLISFVPFAEIPRDPPPFFPFVFIIALLIFCSALIILVRSGRPTASALILIGVWTLLTTLSTMRWSVTTYFPAFLIVPICAAALLIDRVASLSLTTLATVFILTSSWLEVNGSQLSNDGLIQLFRIGSVFQALFFWIGIFWAVALLTSLLADGLQRALRESRAHAEDLRLLSEQLEIRVKEQTEQLLDQERKAAIVDERARLARDIHDTLAQGLAGVVVQIAAGQRALEAAPSEADEHLYLAHRMARETLSEARRSVWNLRAPALERGDLGDALRGLVERQSSSSTRTSFVQQGEPQPLPMDVEAALLRVGQEALANIARHAGATWIQMTLEYASNQITLTIQDNGIGFDPDSFIQPIVPGPTGGFGLLGMRERLAAVGGTLELTSAQGAIVVASVPLRAGGAVIVRS